MIDSKYKQHEVFDKLTMFANFYKELSLNVMSFISMGTNAILNIDTYAFSSIQGTLESIRQILLSGRINDAYALLRKYHDSALINVYCSLYLEDNCTVENFIVLKINNWVKGTEQIPQIRVINNYISNSDRISGIRGILEQDKRYNSLRDRCNDHTHYNFYKNLLLNDNQIYLENRQEELNYFARDLDDIFIMHFAYVFYIKNHYMASSDYMDYMDAGMTPPEGIENEVSPFIQEMFDLVIKKNRPDIANEMLRQTGMTLV